MITGAMNDCNDEPLFVSGLCGCLPPVLGVDAAESDAVHWVVSPEENPTREKSTTGHKRIFNF